MYQTSLTLPPPLKFDLFASLFLCECVCAKLLIVLYLVKNSNNKKNIVIKKSIVSIISPVSVVNIVRIIYTHAYVVLASFVPLLLVLVSIYC